MAGGNWIAQNKVLPGVYINYVGSGTNPPVESDKGVVGIPSVFSWLKEKTLIRFDRTSAKSLADDFGEDARLITEAMKNSAYVYFYRLNAGTKATATIGNLVCTALYSGAYGNRLSISVENTVGQTGKYDVITWLDTTEIDRQTVADITGLADNSWIKFTKSASDTALSVNAGTNLIDGTDGTPTSADYADFLSQIELQAVDAIACPTSDPEVKALFVAFEKRMIQEEGKYLQTVVPDLQADFEGVISVKNGVILEDGTHITKELATTYAAGATAACLLTDSLTNARYIGAVDVDARYSTTQQIEYAKAGHMVFIPSPVGGNEVWIQRDANTLTTFTDKKTYALSKNESIRALFTVNREINNRGMSNYIGKVKNGKDGRNLYHASILEYFRNLEKSGALSDVVPEDIVVQQGELIDATVVDYAIRPTVTMEKIYNTVVVEG